MASVTFDKKQLPQVIVMGVLTIGVFGYFVDKVFLPPSTQASPAPASTAAASSSPGSTSGTGASSAPAATPTPDPSVLIGADPPTDTMRDPFVAAAAAQASIAAPAVLNTPNTSNPPAPTVPGLNQIHPLPLPGGNLPGLAAASSGGQPADNWMVTGIIQSDNDPSDALAILRDSTDRRYLRLGDQLDNRTRLIGIDRDSITLLRNGQHIQLGVSDTVPTINSGSAPAASGSGTAITPMFPINAASNAAQSAAAPEPKGDEAPTPPRSAPHHGCYPAHGAAD